MCPACFLAIGGGILVARKFEFNIVFFALSVMIISILTNYILLELNRGKVFFPYQKVIVTVAVMFTAILIFKYLL